MIQLPQLHESLLIANERLVDRARRRARLFRTGLISTAAVVSIGGAATAATALWDPVLGHEDGNRPTASSTPVPSIQEQLLGVLRRPQTSADRGPVARAALGALSRQYVGVRLGAVRLAYDGGPDAGIAIVPIASLAPRTSPAPGPATDALCVFQTGGAGSTVGCFGTDAIRRGGATGSDTASGVVWGLVPVGVARVVVHGTSGDRELPVADNLFTTRSDLVDPSHIDVEWLDGEGSTVPPTGGRPMDLPVFAAGAEGEGPDGYHDCGRADGGVVPEAVRCGRAARAWHPAPGVATPSTPGDAP